MRTLAPAFVLGLVALGARAPGQQADRVARPEIERLEVPRLDLAPIEAKRAPARTIPEPPSRKVRGGLAPNSGRERLHGLTVARSGRLELIANQEVAGEPIPPPRDPEAWDEDEEEQPVIDRPEVRLISQNLDNWVYGSMDTDALRREWLGSVLEDHIASALLYHRLTESQVEKLRLAARGDIKRLFAEVEAARANYEANRSDLRRGLAALQDTAPLSRRFREGPFGEGSLFRKVLDHMTGGRR